MEGIGVEEVGAAVAGCGRRGRARGVVLEHWVVRGRAGAARPRGVGSPGELAAWLAADQNRRTLIQRLRVATPCVSLECFVPFSSIIFQRYFGQSLVNWWHRVVSSKLEQCLALSHLMPEVALRREKMRTSS